MPLTDALLLDPHAFNVWIAYRTDGIKGSGTINDPYNGGTQAAFDAAMAGLPDGKPVRVHLGPTTAQKPFITGGFFLGADGTPVGFAWQPKPNMAIVGSGIDVTHLQLVADSAGSNTHYFAIGAATTNCVDFFEVSDLTIDCNLPSGRSIACGAIRVMGHHVHIHDVKCIRWGSRTGEQPGFVIALIIADPDGGVGGTSPWLAVDNAGLQNCIALDPSPHNDNSEAVVNVFHVGGRELDDNPDIPITQFGRAPYIRNCFIDGECDDPIAAELRALSMAGCHGGVVEGNQIHNIEIGGPFQGNLNARETIVRNNIYRNVNHGPFWEAATSATGIQKLLIEGNIIELTADSGALPVGILIDGDTEPVAHGQVIIRNNRFRFLDGQEGASDVKAIQVIGAAATIIADNMVETIPATGSAIKIENCAAVTVFDNRNIDGELLDATTDSYHTRLEEPSQEVLLTACFEK